MNPKKWQGIVMARKRRYGTSISSYVHQKNTNSRIQCKRETPIKKLITSKSKGYLGRGSKVLKGYSRPPNSISKSVGTHRTVLSVFCLIQLGMGRFCFIALPSLRLMRNVLLEPCKNSALK
jgi:hypothetical protein